MRRLVATIVTLSFLFALSATSGIVLSADAHAATLSQAHPTQAAPNLTADVPLIQKDGELNPILLVAYELDSLYEEPCLVATPFARYLDVYSHSDVPLYIVARRLQI